MTRGTKTNARLLLKALKKGIDVPGLVDVVTKSRNPVIIKYSDDPLESLVIGLEKFPTRTYKALRRIFPLTDDELETICSCFFSSMLSFLIIGCPTSTDVDVVIIVDKHANGEPFPLLTTEYSRFVKEMAEIGYTDPSLFDVSLICIEDETVIATSKGGMETQNIINATYKYHTQKYPLPTLCHHDVEIINKLRVIAKFLLDKLERVAKDYASIRAEKKEAYHNGVEYMLEFTRDIHDHIVSFSKEKIWVDVMKSLTMKYIQLLLAKEGKYVYTKPGLIDAFAEMFPDQATLTSGVSWFLTRGKSGEYSDELIRFLHKQYVMIMDAELEKRKPTIVKYEHDDVMAVSPVRPEILEEFMRSPKKATPKFQELWTETYGDDINDCFPIVTTEAKEMEPLLGDLFEKFIFIDQRSTEWLNLITYYKCGRNSGNVGAGFDGKFNLLRGSMTELMVMELFDPSPFGKFKKCFTGLIVAEKGVKGALGCAPDMVLVSEKEIIPVEIKTLKSGTRNSGYYRGLELARRQCQSVKDILEYKSSPTHKIERGLILLAYHEDGDLMMHQIQISLD